MSNQNNTQQQQKKKPKVIGRALIDFGFEHREVDVEYFRTNSGIYTIFSHDRETGNPIKILVHAKNAVLIMDRSEYIPRDEI